MKRLVLLGEGHGEVKALPVLIRKLLKEKDTGDLCYLDRDVIRLNPGRLVKWDKSKNQPGYSPWISRVTLAARRRDVGGILAVFDGDFKNFPAGSNLIFCAASVAKSMAVAAVSEGAGKAFSLSLCCLRMSRVRNVACCWSGIFRRACFGGWTYRSAGACDSPVEGS